MILDWTEKSNKKYIPIVTFVLGCAVGAVAWRFYWESKAAKLEAGGAVAPAAQAPATVIQVAAPAAAPAMQAAPAPAPVMQASGAGMPM